MMQLGDYPANHEREFPELARVEHASPCLDADDSLLPVVESVDKVDEAMLREA